MLGEWDLFILLGAGESRPFVLLGGAASLVFNEEIVLADITWAPGSDVVSDKSRPLFIESPSLRVRFSVFDRMRESDVSLSSVHPAPDLPPPPPLCALL